MNDANENNDTSLIQATHHQQGHSPLVSTITAADKKLLQETVHRIRPHSKNYEDSWGYVIQATRYEGRKWYDPATGSLIFFGRKSPTDPTLVVPSFFAEPAYLRNVVELVHHALNAPQTILKNIYPHDVLNFTPFGFRLYEEGEGWSKEARFDDQTYPQLLVNLQKLAEAKGTIYENLRVALRRRPDITIRKYRDTDRDAVLEIFTLKDGYTKDDPERIKGMYYASHAMYPTSETDKLVVTDKVTDKVVGFTVTSVIASKTIAFVASGFRPDAKSTSIWGIYQTLAAKYHEGFELANLGGCEFETTYTFKREKFRPVEQLEKTHLVFTG